MSPKSGNVRRVRLFRDGGNQALRIPREFELGGSEVLVRQEGDRLVIEPIRKGRLLELLATLPPLDDEFPDVDETLPPADDFAAPRPARNRTVLGCGEGTVVVRGSLVEPLIPPEFTAVIKQSGEWWIGWIQEVPGVNCQERTREDLRESLASALAEIIELNRKQALAAAGGDYREEKIVL